MSERRKRERLLSMLPERKVTPPCAHAPACGGCLMQEWSYEDQYEAKLRWLAEVYLSEITLHPAEDVLGYRNRIDFAFSKGALGLREHERFDRLVDVHDCLLLPEHARDAFSAARDLLLASDLPTYDLQTQEGFLRYLVIRTSRETQEIMLIVTTASKPEYTERFRTLLREMHERIGATSTHWRINASQSDVSIGEPFELLGEPCIMDMVGGLYFCVHPETFFQANTRGAAKLFERGIEFASGRVLDLYCGVGVITLLAHDAAQEVIGIDRIKESVAAAQENARRNGLTKCSFLCADVPLWLRQCTERFDTIICDPARPGLGAQTCSQLLDLAPERIVYISCNPLTHKQDLALLKAKYEVELLEGYDLFPQTSHVEILSVLRKRSE